MSKFEDNGGYYIDGVPYMDCKITGQPVRNVSTDCKEVIGDKALSVGENSDINSLNRFLLSLNRQILSCTPKAYFSKLLYTDNSILLLIVLGQ